MAEEILNNSQTEQLWLTVAVKDQLFAIDSYYVQSIFQLSQGYTKVPNAPPSISGIMKVRDDVISLIDLRILLGHQTIDQESEEFYQMLETRKQDHIKWVTELKRCIDHKDEFTLATDSHKCAFGKWYDNYVPTNLSVKFHLKKIDEPHHNLHQTAIEAFECPKDCEKCERDECLEDKLKKSAEEYMNIVVGLLDEAKTVFKDSFKKMCVVVLHEGKQKGILVDAVSAVERLTILSDAKSLYQDAEKSFVKAVGESQISKDKVLLLELDSLIKSIH